MVKLAGKIAIVTGSASGIGESCARALAAEGADVVMADIDISGVEAAAGRIRDLGGKATAAYLDLAVEASIAELCTSVVERTGRIDILHNNAADLSLEYMQRDLSIMTMDADVWDRAFTVNSRGTMLMIKHALPAMIQGGGGSIINTSSSSSLMGDLSNPAYAASKAAINSLTRYVATQFGKQGVRCNAIAPGMIVTEKARIMSTTEQLDMIARHNLAPGLGAPADIAAAALWLASDESKFVTAQIISIDGGLTAHMPFFAEAVSAFSAANDLPHS